MAEEDVEVAAPQPSQIVPPTTVALNRALQIAGVDEIEYLVQALKERLTQAHFMDNFKEIFDEFALIEGQAKVVQDLPLNSVWLGLIDDWEEKQRCRKDYHYYVAKKDLKAIEESVQNKKAMRVTMIFAIDPQSKFMRGYLVNPDEIEPGATPSKVQ